MAEFLFEIGLEEIPARMIAGAQAELERRLVGMLERERLIASGVETKSFSTPRRLAVWVKDVAPWQEDMSEELLGPSAKIAYKDGVATPAAVAFAKKAGVAVEDLKTVATPKGEYLAATSVKAGRGASEVIAAELPKELAGIYWAKNMYWRAGKPERFVRPVRWMVAMLGDAVVPVAFAGKTAASVTYGHRVLFGSQEIPLAGSGAYERTLLDAFVVVDVEARRHRIRKALDRVCRAGDTDGAGLRWREDHALVDKLTHLTEWASGLEASAKTSVVMGEFEAAYLELPEEVLVTVMRDHQSYFAVEDKAGKLAPYFLAVLNMEADEAGLSVIRHGNARVLRARFNDARFFWEFDQRVPLVERVKLLESVTFQKDLGSYAKKAERVRVVAAALAGLASSRGAMVNVPALEEAVTLAKADLTSELVKEFTELQGVVGGLYARAQGFSEATAEAIYDQYLPESMEDSVPRTIEGTLLAISDKADTIAGMFGLGLEPTGSKDPFALRRAANGIVKTLAESSVALPLTLGDVADAATKDEAVRVRVEVFFAERLEFYLREAKGQAYDVVKAVLAAGANDVRDAVSRAEAVTAVRGGEDFAAVCAAFKRMRNILNQAEERGEDFSGVVGVSAVPIELEELSQAALIVKVAVQNLQKRKDYVAAFQKIATLRPMVDLVFAKVMILDSNPLTRRFNLASLFEIVSNMRLIADLSEIVTPG